MQQKLKIEFRQKQLYKNNDLTQPIVVACDDTCTPSYNPGTVPQGEWIDMTRYTEGLNDLEVSWDAQTTDNSANLNESTDTNDVGSNYQKGVSDELRFSGDAFDFIYNWMMLNTCQILNSVEVQITDVDCDKTLRIFEIKIDNLTYAPKDEPCILSTLLREADPIIKAIETTIIEDDWQHWFNSDGASTKDHPAFIYTVEKKPQFILSVLMAIAYICGMLSTGIIIALTAGQEWIRKVMGVSYFCTAPYIQTYLDNFCNKYGYTRNTIFDAGQPYENLCLFFPVQEYYENHDDYDSPSTKFSWNNRTGMPVNVFLDQLKKVFNAQWYCTPNKELVFQPISYFNNLEPIYDFSLPGAMPLYKLKYEFNGNKKPSYGDYEYRIDPQDTCSNDLKWRYCTIVDFDQLTYNPMLEGSIKKTFDFASTSFVYDGATKDFLKSAIEDGRTIAEVAILVGLIALFAAADFLTAAITAGMLTAGYLVTNNFINDFFNKDEIRGSVRVSSNVINVPRLLLKDPATSNTRAKVVSVTNPNTNPFYNQDGSNYYTKHPAFNADPNYFGSVISDIFNYPMYVDEDFTGNLYDRFQEYDNPVHNPIINQDWEAYVDACCSMMDVLGVWSDESIKIGSVVILEKRGTSIIKGRIEHIGLSYKTGMINLKGNVLGCFNATDDTLIDDVVIDADNADVIDSDVVNINPVEINL